VTVLDIERKLQESIDKGATCTSFSLQVPRNAKLTVYAATYVSDPALTAPSSFDDVTRGNITLWGCNDEAPRVINWTELSSKDWEAITPILQSTNNWILITLSGSARSETTSYLRDPLKP